MEVGGVDDIVGLPLTTGTPVDEGFVGKNVISSVLLVSMLSVNDDDCELVEIFAGTDGSGFILDDDNRIFAHVDDSIGILVDGVGNSSFVNNSDGIGSVDVGGDDGLDDGFGDD